MKPPPKKNKIKKKRVEKYRQGQFRCKPPRSCSLSALTIPDIGSPRTWTGGRKNSTPFPFHSGSWTRRLNGPSVALASRSLSLTLSLPLILASSLLLSFLPLSRLLALASSRFTFSCLDSNPPSPTFPSSHSPLPSRPCLPFLVFVPLLLTILPSVILLDLSTFSTLFLSLQPIRSSMRFVVRPPTHNHRLPILDFLLAHGRTRHRGRRLH